MPFDAAAAGPTDDSAASDPTTATDGAGATANQPVSPDVLAKQTEDQTAMLGHLRHIIQMFTEKNAHLAKNVSCLF